MTVPDENYFGYADLAQEPVVTVDEAGVLHSNLEPCAEDPEPGDDH